MSMEIEEKENWYEKMCKISERIIKIKPDKKTCERIEKACNISHLSVTPEGVGSFTFLSSFAILILGFVITILGIYLKFPISYGIFVLFFAIPIGYYIYNYPMIYERRFLISAGSELTFLILYMIIYIRDSPNMEGALKFASENLSGPLGKDMRRLMWEIETGKYSTADEALIDYLKVWKEEKYFIEAVQLIRESLKYPEDRRLATLDEAISIVLQGSEDNTRRYSQALKTPIMILHAMGILLPVIGLVMFPIIGIFMNIKSEMLFLGYNVILPLILLFFISEISQRRPATVSRIVFAENPNLPPPGKFALRIGKKYKIFSSLIFALLLSFPIIFSGIFLYLNAEGEKLIESMIITISILIFFILFFYLSSFQKISFREKIRNMEEEFSESLFQLGNYVSTGIPIEVAIQKIINSIGELEIKDFFSDILKNMKRLGMSFSKAVFDSEYGAIKKYPSTLIKSIMRVVADASRRGVQVAAMTMLNISKYLRSIHIAQERIKDMLSDVLSSLRFQGFFLTPLVAGIIVTIATIIIRILSHVSKTAGGFETQSYLGGLPFVFGEIGITPGAFQLICSLYFIESTLLVAKFVNTIENGEDEIGFQNTALKMLFFGSITYFLSFLITLLIFGPMVKFG